MQRINEPIFFNDELSTLQERRQYRRWSNTYQAIYVIWRIGKRGTTESRAKIWQKYMRKVSEISGLIPIMWELI